MPADLQVKLEELLSQELALYKKLRTMVSREIEAIVLDKDMDELLRILERKQDPISSLQLLADSWQDVLSSADVHAGRDEETFWDRLSALVPEEGCAALEKLLQEARAAADDLMKAEAEALAELEKHAACLRAEIVSLAKGHQAAAHYAKMGGVSF